MFFLQQDPPDCGDQLFALADRRLQRLARHVTTTLHEPLTLRRAAEISGLSPTWFSKYFHAHTGITFADWYRRVRVERAKILLGEGDLKVEVIAYDVGYRRVGTFERAFRTCTGVCPKGYRAALRSMRGPAPQRMPTGPQQTPIAPQQTPNSPRALLLSFGVATTGDPGEGHCNGNPHPHCGRIGAACL